MALNKSEKPENLISNNRRLVSQFEIGQLLIIHYNRNLGPIFGAQYLARREREEEVDDKAGRNALTIE